MRLEIDTAVQVQGVSTMAYFVSSASFFFLFHPGTWPSQRAPSGHSIGDGELLYPSQI
jgi:hypothetical protein